MDLSIIITIIILFSGIIVLCSKDISIFIYDKYYIFIEFLQRIKDKKNEFYLSESYVVGFPSGEIIFLKDEKLNFLLSKQLIRWNIEYKCYCYHDYDKKYIIKILKF